MLDERAPIFENLQQLVDYANRSTGGEVVLAGGCFDPLHAGHVRYLNEAKGHGRFLVVALHDDQSTRRLKGTGRPVVPAADRAVIIASLKMVDAVLLLGDDGLHAVLRALAPAVYARGDGHAVGAETAGAAGTRIVTVGGPKLRSSSDVVSALRRGAQRKDDA